MVGSQNKLKDNTIFFVFSYYRLYLLYMAKGFYSKIYDISLNDFTEIVKTSSTYTEILRKCGFENKGCNINTLKRRLEFEKIDTDHIQKGYGHNKGKSFLDKRISIED